MSTETEQISVLCVDDNEQVTEAIRVKFRLNGGFRWIGSLQDAKRLVQVAREKCPDVVLLDIDIPGADPFVALQELSGACPDVRVIMFSGHVRREFIDQAVAAGAWGYVSKNDASEELLAAIKAVAKGNFVLSTEVRATCDFS